MAARSPIVAFQNPSVVHIGPRQQNNTPATVNQYLTVIDDDDPSTEHTYEYIDTITPQPPAGENPVGKYS
jgi:hypothetical protein